MSGTRDGLWWDLTKATGPPGGAPVVLLPPTSRNARYWPPALISAIIGTGRAVVRVDLRGQGRSVWGPTSTMAALVEDVSGIQRSLASGPVHLLGAGLGGLVAQQMAIERPEAVSALTVISSSGWYVDPGLPGSPEEIVAGIWLRRRMESTEETIRTLVRNEQALAGTGHFDEEATTAAVTNWVEHGFSGEDYHRELLVNTPDQKARLVEFLGPVLVVHGGADPYLPVAHGAALTDSFPSARLAVIERMGHGLPPGGAAEAIGIITGFLAGHPDQSTGPGGSAG